MGILKQPFAIYLDTDGKPLENGQVFIGQAGFEARSTPKPSFFDVAMTIPTGTAIGAAVRTRAGYIVNNGAAVNLYVEYDYSITVLRADGSLVYSSLNAAPEGSAVSSSGGTPQYDTFSQVQATDIAENTIIIDGTLYRFTTAGAVVTSLNGRGFRKVNAWTAVLPPAWMDAEHTENQSAPGLRIFNGVFGGGDSASRIQGVCYDKDANEWFCTHSIGGSPEQCTITRMDITGARISTSAITTLIGHGQDVDVVYVDGVRWFFSQNTAETGASRWRYVASAEVSNYASLTLFDGGGYTTVNLDRDKQHLVAISAYGTYYLVRMWRIADVMVGVDHRNTFISETRIDRTFYALSENVVQSVTAADGAIYILSGNGQIGREKYLSLHDVGTGELVIRQRIRIQRDFAALQNSGASTKYEPEGMTWFYEPDTPPFPVVGFAMDSPTSGSTRNYAIAVRSATSPALTVNGDWNWQGIGLMIRGGAHDICVTQGSALQISRVTPGFPTPVITPVGRLTSNDTWIMPWFSSTGLVEIPNNTAIVIPLPQNSTRSAIVQVKSLTRVSNRFTGSFYVSGDASPGIALMSFFGSVSGNVWNNTTLPSDVVFTTGILTGTTGAVGKLTFSAHTNGNMYIENRTGSDANLDLLGHGT